MLKKSQNCLIALGGNMPLPGREIAETLLSGADRLAALAGTEIRLSGLYSTPCFPAGSGPDYVNAAGVLTFEHGADALLALMHLVEAEFGRARVQRWGQRTLDLDLIAYGDTVAPDAETQTRWRNLPLAQQIKLTPDQLILPHPRLQDRAFVLVPLSEVAADWVHPLTGQSIRQMRDALDAVARAEVTPI